MSYWLDEPRRPHEMLTIRTLWVTIALSLLVHSAAFFVFFQGAQILTPDKGEPDLASDRLEVRLAATPKLAPVQLPAPREIIALPRSQPRPPKATVRAPPPPVIASAIQARPPPAPPMPAPPPAPTPAPASQATQPIESDLWSYIQARRRARGEPETPAIDPRQAALNANLAANLPRPATGAATPDPKRGGGIFEIKRMDYDDAAFVFFGWNRDMGRTTPQLIEVRKGNNADMRIAVVRKMIAIIREYSQTDFVWRSQALGRDLVLSARLSDNAELEAFLMREMFDDRGRP